MPVDWTEERVELLTRLWLDGRKAWEIGERFGVSKGAIAGKARRLGLPMRRKSPRKRLKVAKPKKPRKIFVFEKGLPKAGKKVAPPKPTSESRFVDFWGLNSTTCRMPLWEEGAPFAEQQYCGAPCGLDQPYCDEHQQVASQARGELAA